MPQIGEVRGETIRSLVGSGNPLPLGFAVVERGHIEDPAARSSTNRYESIDNGDAFGAIGQNSRSPGHSSGCLPPELPLGLAVVGVWESTGPAASSARSRKTDLPGTLYYDPSRFFPCAIMSMYDTITSWWVLNLLGTGRHTLDIESFSGVTPYVIAQNAGSLLLVDAHHRTTLSWLTNVPYGIIDGYGSLIGHYDTYWNTS